MIIGVDVAPLPFGPVLEVNRFFWAVVEAGHATHAIIAPHREALFKFDVMKRTAHDAGATMNAAIVGVELLWIDAVSVETSVAGKRHEGPDFRAVKKGMASLNISGDFFRVVMSFFQDFGLFFFGKRFEFWEITDRHFQIIETAEMPLFVFAEFFQVIQSVEG